jgi:Reverse transcriptase (RNA-dependent DNA polymerase)
LKTAIDTTPGTKKGQGKKRKRVEGESIAQNGSPANVQGPAAVNTEGDGLPATTGAENEATEEVPATTTRSGRKAKPARRLIEVMTAEIMDATSGDVSGEIFAYASMFPHDDQRDYANPLLAYKAVSDPDTLYYHEAMREHDKDRFQESMLKEISDQFDNGNFTVVHKSEVPSEQTILPAVWQMKRKRDAKTGSIKKYKARLSIDGSRMKYGVHYHETYSPVASWNSVRMLLTLTAVHGWHTKQIDFVQAFAQAPVERTLYMKIPAGVEIEGGLNVKDHVLKIHRNIYGQKQAGRVWNKFLVRKLVTKLGFKQSRVDECVFYRGNVLYVLYTDDSLIAGPDPDEINQVIQELQDKAKLSITVEGDLADFLGVNIERKKDGTIHLSQPHLIDQILEDLRLKDEEVKVKTTPAATSKLLCRHSDSPSFDNSFNYRSVIGKVNYLEKASRPDIS